jgi:tetratricopeptide (TPR) repeat protein
MRITTILIALTIFSLIAAPAVARIHDARALAADPAKTKEPIAPKLKGLGDYHFTVTTHNPESQRFFNQGLRLTYAFNHSEALRAFKEAARLDQRNAMAYWGWALVLGHDRKPFDMAYARAMAKLVESYPDDIDAATLYAASLMNLSPWDYWNLDGSPKGDTEEILKTLQSVVDRNPRHAGALHYYIHVVELSHPERGERHADMLGELMPGAGHLVHMPSHIYMRVGRFADSYEANRRAVEADEDYITQCRSQGIYPLNYYPHNIHFMAWSAMLQGHPKRALEAARKIVEKVPPELSADKNVWAL